MDIGLRLAISPFLSKPRRARLGSMTTRWRRSSKSSFSMASFTWLATIMKPTKEGWPAKKPLCAAVSAWHRA
jgi:hypothetical protein